MPAIQHTAQATFDFLQRVLASAGTTTNAVRDLTNQYKQQLQREGYATIPPEHMSEKDLFGLNLLPHDWWIWFGEIGNSGNRGRALSVVGSFHVDDIEGLQAVTYPFRNLRAGSNSVYAIGFVDVPRPFVIYPPNVL